MLVVKLITLSWLSVIINIRVEVQREGKCWLLNHKSNMVIS